ncbi:MAG: nickel-dependent hydrogenase large subunit, partial [Myxococcales bacterium]|nr:nickel-dependent hydrogenase large subunit [Myxococcales bacterium]
MAKRLTIDPITRIEGHLRIDVEVDKGSINKAWASCTMWRGIENILIGRDSREAWAFTQRFCGVCTTVHAMASVRAVEDALKLDIPKNAQFIRNLILIAHGLHDHIVHFYHLSALDWVDVTTIPQADPKKASAVAESISDWPGNSSKALEAVKQKVVGLLQSGQLGIFQNGYWGHPAMRLSPELNLVATAHYLQALEFQRKANQIVGILGGKTPHVQNLLVGGVANAINLNSLATVNMDKLYQLKALFDETLPFVHQVYLPDAALIAGIYNEWFEYGAGYKNYLAVPDLPHDSAASAFDLPGGVIMNGDIAGVRPVKDWKDPTFRQAVTEDVTHAWYEGSGGKHPWKGETKPNYTDFQDDGKYTWVKSPRYQGEPMEVGPLAAVLVGYAQNHPQTVKWTDMALSTISSHAKKKITPPMLQSTMGRYAARAIRAAMLAELAEVNWNRLVDNITSGDTSVFTAPEFPAGAVEGVGLHEAPRGTLSHWTVVEGGRIQNYQAVVPTTWNASPRDEAGKSGPYEVS